MRLYAWQPNGHGEYSWFVMAENEKAAREAVEREMDRRRSIPAGSGDLDRITEYECGGWGTDYYTLTIADPGVVLANDNS